MCVRTFTTHPERLSLSTLNEARTSLCRLMRFMTLFNEACGGSGHVNTIRGIPHRTHLRRLDRSCPLSLEVAKPWNVVKLRTVLWSRFKSWNSQSNHSSNQDPVTVPRHRQLDGTSPLREVRHPGPSPNTTQSYDGQRGHNFRPTLVSGQGTAEPKVNGASVEQKIRYELR